MSVLGVDIGGSGIKGAPVDVGTGEFLTERTKIETPRPADPESVIDVVATIVSSISDDDAAATVGVTFPGVVREGVTMTAANLEGGWVGTSLADRLEARLDRPVLLVNDADAAGVAEMRFGAGRGCDGVVLVATLGTGIGSAIFTRGVLVPNTELGHLQMHGDSAERWAAANVRKQEGLSWKEWAERLDEYLAVLDALLNPDRIVLGGGVSRRADRFLDRICSPRAEVVVAELRNAAGIVGAALLANELVERDARNEPVTVSEST